MIDMKLGVKRGGQFNRWDLQVSSGLLARCRSLLTIEEHGANKQFLRLKCWPVYSWSTLLSVLPLSSIAAAAAMDQEWIITGIFVFLSLLIIGKFFSDASAAMNNTKLAFDQLSESALGNKESRHIRSVDLVMEYELHNFELDVMNQTVPAGKSIRKKAAADA